MECMRDLIDRRRNGAQVEPHTDEPPPNGEPSTA